MTYVRQLTYDEAACLYTGAGTAEYRAWLQAMVNAMNAQYQCFSERSPLLGPWPSYISITDWGARRVLYDQAGKNFAAAVTALEAAGPNAPPGVGSWAFGVRDNFGDLHLLATPDGQPLGTLSPGGLWLPLS